MAVFGIPIAHEDDPERAVRRGAGHAAALRRFTETRMRRDATAPR